MMDINKFEEIIGSFYNQMNAVESEKTGIKLAEDKWSLREIVGHLIDSASNNHQRFVRLQFEDLLGFPPYDGEEWIKAQNYNGMGWNLLVALWLDYNQMLLKVIENIDEVAFENVWVKGETAIPLKELIPDYYRHIELHAKHFNDRLEEIDAMK